MSKEQITVFNLNIEKREHLDRIIPFLEKISPDVVCLQELAEPDLEIFRKALKMDGAFAPMTYIAHNGLRLAWGLGFLTRLPHDEFRAAYYHGNPSQLREFRKENQDTAGKALLYSTLRKGEIPFTVGTTHFTWTPDGKIDGKQKRDLQAFFRILKSVPKIVFCGDFNAPRGQEIFGAISSRYKDNVPLKYTTSIDGNLHRNGALDLMVDGIFSTDDYEIKNTELIPGLSDHCAIVARIHKA